MERGIWRFNNLINEIDKCSCDPILKVEENLKKGLIQIKMRSIIFEIHMLVVDIENIGLKDQTKESSTSQK